MPKFVAGFDDCEYYTYDTLEEVKEVIQDYLQQCLKDGMPADLKNFKCFKLGKEMVVRGQTEPDFHISVDAS